MSGNRVPDGTINVSGRVFEGESGAEEDDSDCAAGVWAFKLPPLARNAASVRSGHIIFMSYPRSQLRCAIVRRGCRYYTPSRLPHKLYEICQRSHGRSQSRICAMGNLREQYRIEVIKL